MSKILLIEDDDVLRQLIGMNLRALGHQVVEAFDGGDGKEKVETDRFDLILTDLTMPGMIGVEIIAELKRLRPDLAMIAMTGGSRSEVEILLRDAGYGGIVPILIKPFTNPLLEAAIGDALHFQGGAQKR